MESLRSQGETSSWRDLVGVMFSLPVSDMSVWRVSLRCDLCDSDRLDCLDSPPWDRLDCLDSLYSDRLDCLDSPPWDRLDCRDSLHSDRLDCLDSGCCERWEWVFSVLFSHLNRRYVTGHDSFCNMRDSMSIIKALIVTSEVGIATGQWKITDGRQLQMSPFTDEHKLQLYKYPLLTRISVRPCKQQAWPVRLSGPN